MKKIDKLLICWWSGCTAVAIFKMIKIKHNENKFILESNHMLAEIYLKEVMRCKKLIMDCKTIDIETFEKLTEDSNVLLVRLNNIIATKNHKKASKMLNEDIKNRLLKLMDDTANLYSTEKD